MNEIKRKLILFLLLIFGITVGLFSSASYVYAQESTESTSSNLQSYEAIIEEILEEGSIVLNGQDQEYQDLKCKITKGDKEGESVTVENGKFSMGNVVKYEEGDRVYLSPTVDIDGNEAYFITGYVRTRGIITLFVIFVVVAILVASKSGVTSLASMVVSFLIILYFILPRLQSGGSPVWVVILASIFLIPVTFYISHGFNKRTTVAILGTFLAFIVTCVLAQFAVNLTNLTGYSSDEAMFLQAANGGSFDIKGLFLAGIIVGLLGILDDITVAQVSVVYQIDKVAKDLDFKDLYRNSMDVGKNHIASMINTLILVSAGSSLPLLLLFLDDSISFTEVINYEIVASEIVSTLVGSISLILAVPITTILACYFVKKNTSVITEDSDSHVDKNLDLESIK